MMNRGGEYRHSIGASSYAWDAAYRCDVKQIRSKCLLQSRRCSMLADPDAVPAASEGEETVYAFSVEVKTMVSVRTVQEATSFSLQYEDVIYLKNVGVNPASTALFKKLVPTGAHRALLQHRVSTLSIGLRRGDGSVNDVLYVVGTDGSMTEGRILYVCHIRFAEALRHTYTYYMDCVRVSSLSMIL